MALLAYEVAESVNPANFVTWLELFASPPAAVALCCPSIYSVIADADATPHTKYQTPIDVDVLLRTIVKLFEESTTNHDHPKNALKYSAKVDSESPCNPPFDAAIVL
jgi:hypothetical protein